MNKLPSLVLLLSLGVITGALLAISFNLHKLVNKKIEPEILTQTVRDGRPQ